MVLPGSIKPFQLSYPGLDHLIHVLRARAEDLAQDLLSCLEFLGHYVYWLDVLAHKEDLLLRVYKLLEGPCHDQTIVSVGPIFTRIEVGRG